MDIKDMILSASGWRKIFAASGMEQDKSPAITDVDAAFSYVAAEVFLDYLVETTGQQYPVLAVGMDTRPTGPAITEAILRALIGKKAIVQFLGVSAAPEIMAYAKKLDGFIYVSASHNPIGHNGIKFGLNDGGVLSAKENAKLASDFKNRISAEGALSAALSRLKSASASELRTIYGNKQSSKHNAIRAYKDFACRTIAGTDDKNLQSDFFSSMQESMLLRPIGVVVDFNGSSRTLSIDRDFFRENKINFYEINGTAGEIAHEIIPEAENLVHVAAEMERLQAAGHKEVVLGYMPDCDGDRGNIVYWDEKAKKAVILKAQEVFSLSVLAELTYAIWVNSGAEFKPAIAVNCPTSMRIEGIAKALGAEVFRAEVGEANVVNLAREKRNEGFSVPILGEGSNGGTITYPASVRDPLNTVFAFIKLLTIRDAGLYELWCEKSGHEYKSDFTLTDVLESLPAYTTTGVSEERAILRIKNTNHADLKAKFQKEFEKDWEKNPLREKYNLTSYEAVITNGTVETRNVADWSESGKGGLKILFYSRDEDKNESESKGVDATSGTHGNASQIGTKANASQNGTKTAGKQNAAKSPSAFIWMRGSGTEPVFRIMCDVKGRDEKSIQMEKDLLEWETELLRKADC